jgi:hypothetical protein
MVFFLALLGCTSKQQIIAPTETFKAPTGTFTMTEAGGGKMPTK